MTMHIVQLHYFTPNKANTQVFVQGEVRRANKFSPLWQSLDD